ncbi:hypothetical protein AB0L79_20570, partial [Streptomyces tendae]
APQWPGQSVPQQFHLDFSAEDLDAAEKWVRERRRTSGRTRAARGQQVGTPGSQASATSMKMLET